MEKPWLTPIRRDAPPAGGLGGMDGPEECGDYKRGACFRATCKFLHGGKPASEVANAGIPGSTNGGTAGLPTPKPAGRFEAPAGLDQSQYDMNTGFGLFGTECFGTRFGTNQPLAKIDNVRPLCMDFYKQGFCNRRGPHNQGCLFRHDEIEGKGKIDTGKPEIGWEVDVFAIEAQGKRRDPTRAMAYSDIASAAGSWVSKRKAEILAENKIAADTKAALERVGAAAAGGAPAAASAGAVATLAAGWKETKAPDGRMYYYHAATKKTQWTRPVASAEEAAAAAAATAAQPSLPPGWKEAKSPDGRTYYFRPGSNLTQWTRPVAEEPKVEVAPADKPAAAENADDADGDSDENAAKRPRQE